MKAKVYQAPVILVGMAVLLMSACQTLQAPPQGAAPPPPVVTVDHPKQQNVTEFLEFTGQTEAVNTVEVRARVEGYLKNIAFVDGARVNQGDLLFEIDPAPFEATLNESRAVVASREAEFRLAEKVYNRRKNALADKAVSEVAVEEAKAQLDLAEAQIVAAKAQMALAELDLSYARVTAPISGVVSRRMVDEGNLIRSLEDQVLAVIISDDPLYVYFTLSEKDFFGFQGRLDNRVLAKTPIPIRLGLSTSVDFPYSGQIDYVENRIDPMSGTIQARAVIPNNDHRLVAGLYARVQVPLRQLDDALLVPEAVLSIGQQGRFVLVVDEQDQISARPVTIGSMVGQNRVIRSGLDSGDRVVVKGMQRVQPGMPVTVKMLSEMAGAGEGMPGGGP